METLLATALLLLDPATLSQAPPEPPLAPIEDSVRDEPSETDHLIDNLEVPLNCGPNQFPSAFLDVYPTDWAYQAVNRLASRSIECFEFPSERSFE